jgi:hypothetical protein
MASECLPRDRKVFRSIDNTFIFHAAGTILRGVLVHLFSM